jgi:hypothetical protein
MEEFPILYDMTQAHCKDSKEKDKVWDDIGENLGDVGKCENKVLILLILKIFVSFSHSSFTNVLVTLNLESVNFCLAWKATLCPLLPSVCISVNASRTSSDGSRYS